LEGGERRQGTSKEETALIMSRLTNRKTDVDVAVALSADTRNCPTRRTMSRVLETKLLVESNAEGVLIERFYLSDNMPLCHDRSKTAKGGGQGLAYNSALYRLPK